MENNKSEGLKRELGIFDVAVNVINITIASGIFLLPSLIAGILGSASIVAYMLCGSMFLLVALCYAEAGSRVTSSGGAYAYIEKAFGDYPGFIANALLWFGTGVLASAALINGFADMLSIPFPIFNSILYRGILFAVFFVFFAYVNIRDVKQGMKLVKTITLLKALPLIILVAVGLFSINTKNLQWEGFPSFDKLGEASIILFFAFAGGETAINISGEMKNPNKTAPLGLLLGITSMVIFYSLVQIVAQSTLGAELNNQKAPLAAAAGILLGSWGTALLFACGLIAIFSCLYSLVLVFPRVLFAGANDGLLPKFLSNVHPKYSTPNFAIISFCIISFIMAITGGFKQLIVLATISMLLLYIGVALAAIKFRMQSNTQNLAAFKLPGGIAIPVLTLIILSWFLFQSKSSEIIAISVFLGVITILFVLNKILKRK